MQFEKISPGENPPSDINVVIEVAQNSYPVKYEIDHETSALNVDRFIPTPMFYPANYGFIPNTMGGDNDPLDCLVITPFPVMPGAVIRSRPIGVLIMEDEGGEDEKILALPHNKLTNAYNKINDYKDLEEEMLNKISHFFTRYKDLEANKWVKVKEWQGIDKAHQLITKAIK